jgi:peroxiredoxin
MQKITLASLMAVLAVTIPAPMTAGGALKPGQPAPELRLPAGDGRIVSLADSRGRVLLVDFWASWCGPCQSAFPAVDGLYRELHERGFDVMAVNLDERPRDADAFLAARPHDMPVVFDPQGTSAETFGLEGMPTSFLIGRDGRIRFVHIGYSAKTLDSYRQEIEQLLAEPARRSNHGE